MSNAESQVNEVQRHIWRLEADIDEVERSLAPIRHRLSALVDSTLGVVDKRIGAITERVKQVKRLSTIFHAKNDLEARISDLQSKLDTIRDRRNELTVGLDYSGRASWFEDGMNEYLNAVKRLEPSAWPHRPVEVYLSNTTSTFRVGHRRWDVSLGGTASLYYLMAYHYALLSMSKNTEARVLGFCMIDFPAEFAGTKIADTDDFVVQPFIDMLNGDEFEDTQLIVTGASFSSLKDVNRIEMTEVFVT